MSRQRVFSTISLLSKGLGGHLRRVPSSNLPYSGSGSISLQLPSPRHIFMFSTSQINKKAAPNSEPHINDAKARPAEQGLRLDENPNDVGPRNCPTGTDEEAEQKLREELNKATSENVKLLARAREFEDKYLRALAETENVRTRLMKQIQDSKLFAIQGFCKDLAEIDEILRMAIESVPKEQLSGNNKHLKDLYDGLGMTNARLLQVFKAHGLTQINPIDTKFNPNEHEAVVVQEVPGKEPGTVIFVSKLGYKLHDRVIRPAIVGVAK